ncbi:ATP-binding protein [Cytobacillus oceanisediminis]|uniref:ATP-binding protein n=1 Tax=Cytobacillus oceanisediminis TaxID=665099 RepID=UPI00207A723B|nr:ATP-binding protein [Cytobacillus oceanisediminis]USK43753.1 ATP-binding protein [Cytobacillus oceanisediminis]
MDQVLADLQQKMQNRPLEKQKQQGEHGADNYNCTVCKDTEFILYKNDDGYDFARPCDCQERNAWKRRFKNSMIPDEFTNANFENYQRLSQAQEAMYQSTFDYLKLFKIETDTEGRKKKNIPSWNFGFVAVFGEQRLKELPSSERPAVKQKHNNYGIGKTHLQVSLAKRLIKDGFNVVIVSDVMFMEQLMQAKMMSDEGESYNQLLRNVLNADVLIWDDIGKVNWTEPRERMYYTIINERYRSQKPIVFNSNEDRGSLAEKIGYAAASRLIGQADEFLLETEGTDWRLKKGAKTHV